MVVAGCCTGLGGTAAVEDLVSTDVEVGESRGPFAVEEACPAFRTLRSRRPCNLYHSHIDPVVVSMSEIAQTGRQQGKDQREPAQHSCSNAGAELLLNAAV